jgi:hypothetical protein
MTQTQQTQLTDTQCKLYDNLRVVIVPRLDNVSYDVEFINHTTGELIDRAYAENRERLAYVKKLNFDAMYKIANRNN